LLIFVDIDRTTELFYHRHMVNPEIVPLPTSWLELQAALVVVNKQIERVDENENPLERTQKLNELFDYQDWLCSEIASIAAS
jgi:hypothetical protein